MTAAQLSLERGRVAGERESDRWDDRGRKRPTADARMRIDDLDRATNPIVERIENRRRATPQVADAGGELRERRNLAHGRVGSAVQRKRCLERGERELVDAV